MRILCSFVLAGAAVAEAPDDAAAAADAVQAGRDLARLAARDRPDPWRVADELVRRGARDLAQHFARAAPRPDVARLPAYVAAAPEVDAGLRTALARARTARAARRHAQVLEALAGVEGDTVPEVGAMTLRAAALLELGRLAEAGALFVAAGERAEKLGWLRRASVCYMEAGRASSKEHDFATTAERAARAAAVDRVRGDRAGLALNLFRTGSYLQRLGRADEALAALAESLAIHEERRDAGRAAEALIAMSNVRFEQRAFDTCLGMLRRAEAFAREAGAGRTLAHAIGNQGNVHVIRGEHEKALPLLERALAATEEAGDVVGVARNLANIAALHQARGFYRKALEAHAKALRHARAVGWRPQEGLVHGNIVAAYLHLREYRRALEHARQARDVWAGLGQHRRVAESLRVIGHVHYQLGDDAAAQKAYRDALEHAAASGATLAREKALAGLADLHARRGERARALELRRELLAAVRARPPGPMLASRLREVAKAVKGRGDVDEAEALGRESLAVARRVGASDEVLRTLRFLAELLVVRGRYAEGLRLQEDALRLCRRLDNPHLEAPVLVSMATIYSSLGARDEALAMLERARALHERLDEPLGLAEVSMWMGELHRNAGRPAESLALFRTARERAVALANRALAALCDHGIGMALRDLGRPDEALAAMRRALDANDSAVFRMTVLANTGFYPTDLGRLDEARDSIDRALALAERHGNDIRGAQMRNGLARIALARGEPGAAVAELRASVAILRRLGSALGQQLGTSAREGWWPVIENGILAAGALDDPAIALEFLEAGRAGVLLESLGGSAGLHDAVLPPELRALDARARAAEEDARKAHDAAVADRNRVRIKAARATLAAARRERERVLDRIERAAQANLIVPQPDDAATILARLRADEALVQYALLPARAYALVVTRAALRLVDLGAAAPIVGAADGFRIVPDAPVPLAELKARAVAPLGLGADVRRVLVSPHGALAQVPFALLLRDREVAYVQSGTTYGVLCDLGAARGRGVLALGDPDYRDRTLDRLPASGDEARAVGDTVLLRARASETALRAALAGGRRWRAVHLACHGVVDPGAPLQSALELSASDEDDGRLTALEIFRLKVPADLVVLSACDTARGKVTGAEGVMGLTRAFMLAGAPRVVVSLWKVDDAATRALMAKFHASWAEGRPAAAALRAAQEHVRSHEAWRHPSYWAAWQLWGLAD